MESHSFIPQEVNRILEYAETTDKPNFTQIQLALMEVSAHPAAYNCLREIMEKKFNLKSLNTVLYPN